MTDAGPPDKLLIDTCVWLDLAKDYSQRPLLYALEELTKLKNIVLVAPRIVIEEFEANAPRIIAESNQSLSSALRRAREAVVKFGEHPRKRHDAATELEEIIHKLSNAGEAAAEGVMRVRWLLSGAEVRATTRAIKLRACDRAIARHAPFHRQRNGMGDAIIIETYADVISAARPDQRFAFISHNTKDFSGLDQREPHADLATLFTEVQSHYFTTLGEALRTFHPEDYGDLTNEHEHLDPPPRRYSELLEMDNRLTNMIWYDRHSMRADQVKAGKIKIVPEEEYDLRHHATAIRADIWKGALKAAARVRREIGKDNLGPWTDFEWGMLNGKLSAIRWVLGDDWDVLDT